MQEADTFTTWRMWCEGRKIAAIKWLRSEYKPDDTMLGLRATKEVLTERCGPLSIGISDRELWELALKRTTNQEVTARQGTATIEVMRFMTAYTAGMDKAPGEAGRFDPAEMDDQDFAILGRAVLRIWLKKKGTQP